MQHLNSSAIQTVDYNPVSRILKVWFTESGGPYDYRGVPQNIYDGLIRAGSAGSFFNAYIRDQYR
jgi:KTSC domain